MPKFATYLITLILTFQLGAQAPQSSGDRLYFQYDYKEAVEAYQEQLRRGDSLSVEQHLNLAHSYFKIGGYGNAVKTYLEVIKVDGEMSNHHFNTMLQAMSKSDGIERVKAFLSTRSDRLSNELLENANFNFELLENNLAPRLDYRMIENFSNSNQADFSPSFYGDSQILFASARPQKEKEEYSPTGESFLDIFVGDLSNTGIIQKPRPFDKIARTPFHLATPFYEPQNEFLFYVTSNAENDKLLFDDKGKNALAIGLTDNTGNTRMLLRDLSTSFYYPFYDPESEKLYFAANFEDGYGGTDLYYVYTNKGSIMSAPVNLGPRINTPGNEIAPYIFENSIYFSSDIFYGLGGMDIYKAQILGRDEFSIPVNLGGQVNSAHDEFGFIIRNLEERFRGYFASNRPGGMGNDDIYGFEVAQEPGLETLVFRGRIVKPGGRLGIDKAFFRLFDTEGKLLYEVYSAQDGSFRMEVPWRERVEIKVGKEGFEKIDMTITGSDLSESDSNLNFELASLEDMTRNFDGNRILKVDEFFFSRGSSMITPEIAVILDDAADKLKKFRGIRVKLEAHTDSRGSSASNLALSEKRARAVRDYLVFKGVDSDMFSQVKGIGEEQIRNNCKDGVYCLEFLHRQNERYPLIIQNYATWE